MCADTASPEILTVFCAPDQAQLAQLVASPPTQWPPAQILKQDGGTTVTLLTLAETSLAVKHQRMLTWRQWADALWRGSPARRAWNGAQLLATHGFAVPRPLGVFERRHAGQMIESWYCSEGLYAHLPLHTYWRHHCPTWSFRHRRAFLKALAEFLRSFHAAGLYTGDMRDANLLVEDIGSEQWRFYLVDLDRILHAPPLSQRRRLKNIVQLERTLGRSLHASDRLFFLYRYFGDPLPAPSVRRSFIQHLLHLRNRKDREYARRRRRQRLRQIKAARTTEVMGESVSMPLLPTPPRALISCCIICFNEELHIRRCLESVKWCDEIVVVDSFSTDRTLDICRQYTKHIIQRPWPGFVEQKRFALSQTSHEWVLNIDADEEISPELQREILHVLDRNDPAVDGFFVPRLVYYLGRWWHRGWYPGYRLRLFRRTKVRWGGVDPHEKVLLRGQADRLAGDLYHYTYENTSNHLRAINNLTDMAVRERAMRGKRTRHTDLLLRPLWRFLRFYVLRGTVAYGVPGFFAGVSAAFYVFLKYAKLWEHTTRQQSPSQHSPR